MFSGQASLRFTVELILPGCLVLLTAWLVTAKLRRAGAMTPTEWVTVAAALGVVAYYEEALSRLDTGHIAEMFSAAIPLVVLWTAEGLHLLHAARGRLGWGERVRGVGRAHGPVRGPARGPACPGWLVFFPRWRSR